MGPSGGRSPQVPGPCWSGTISSGHRCNLGENTRTNDAIMHHMTRARENANTRSHHAARSYAQHVVARHSTCQGTRASSSAVRASSVQNWRRCCISLSAKYQSECFRPSHRHGASRLSRFCLGRLLVLGSSSQCPPPPSNPCKRRWHQSRSPRSYLSEILLLYE